MKRLFSPYNHGFAIFEDDNSNKIPFQSMFAVSFKLEFVVYGFCMAY